MDGRLLWESHPWLRVALLGARLYLGGVFVAASLHKIADPGAFAVDIATYEILPTLWVRPAAATLPYVEIAAGLALIVGYCTRAAALIVSALMLVFMAALASAMARGLEISCGCFAAQTLETDPIGWQTMFRDAAWLALGMAILLLDRRPLSLIRAARCLVSTPRWKATST